MPTKKLETVILTKDEGLFTACKLRFAESRVGLTLARDQNEFKTALREKTVDVVMLDEAYTGEILGLSAEDAVLKLAPLLASRVILVLAAPGILPDRVVKLLNLGAHDVIQKPLKPRILAEQLKALVRVFSSKHHRSKKILSSPSDLIVMDYPRRRCYINGVGGSLLLAKTEVRLTKIEFQVLYLLLQKSGAVVTYDDFREHLWPAAVTPKEIIHTLHQLVTNIRKKIAACPVKIENLRAEGFRLT